MRRASKVRDFFGKARPRSARARYKRQRRTETASERMVAAAAPAAPIAMGPMKI